MPQSPPIAETAYVFAPIVRKARDDKGFLTVYGKLTGDDLDLAGQRCDPEWLKSATPSWFSVEPGAGNIREMHQLSAVGKAKSLEEKDDGWYISAKVVDPLAITKVEEGVYSGLSIGIAQPVIDVSQKALATAPNGIIKGGSIIEGSLVDRPCLPSAKLDRALVLAKRAEPGAEVVVLPGMSPDGMVDKGLVRTEELIDTTDDAELIKVDSATGGHSHQHSHGDAGSHTHDHTHNPLPTIRSHESDSQPHTHTHTDSDPELTQDASAAGTDDEDAKEAPSGAKAAIPAPGLGIGDSDAFHRVIRDRMNKAAPAASAPARAPEPEAQVEPPAPAPAPVADPEAAKAAAVETLAPAPAGNGQLSGAALVAELAKALRPVVTKADTAPNKLHTFIDKNGDGKCDNCGKAMGDAMHRRALPGADSKAAVADPVAAALIEMRGVLDKALGVILGKAEDDSKKKPQGLTDAIKKQYVSDLANTAKNSTQDVSNATRRMSQWAAQGAIPTGLTYADLKWMYNQATAELKKRNPKSTAGGNFPALGSGKGLLPDLGLLEKCQAMQDALTAAASTSEGEDTRKAAIMDMGQAILKARGVTPDSAKTKTAPAVLNKGVLPYTPQPYSADDDETVVCSNCGRCNDTDAKNCDQCGADLDPTDDYSADDDEIVICPVCGLRNAVDASFCDQDATQLIGRTDVVLASTAAGDTDTGADGDVDHTDAYRQTIQGLALLIQQEAQEMAGGEDEWACLCRLVAAYKWILAFLAGEQAEGEMLATFSPDAEEIDDDGDGFVLANMIPDPGNGYAPAIATPYLGFATLPDLVKALQAEIAKPEPTPTPEVTKAQEEDVDLTPVTDQLVALTKAMEPILLIEGLVGKMDDMGARLERIEKAPVATGPRRTPPQSGAVPTPQDETRATIDRLTKMATAPETSPVMAEGYRKWAAQLEASLAR